VLAVQLRVVVEGEGGRVTAAGLTLQDDPAGLVPTARLTVPAKPLMPVIEMVLAALTSTGGFSVLGLEVIAKSWTLTVTTAE
jgi:hypothetical protein